MENNILKVNQITVEDTEHYTVLKLLHKLINKINELVYANGDIYDKLDYLLNDGLSKEVVKALTEWLNDGTLSDILTEEVLVEIDSRLDELNAQLYEIANKGTTVEVLERVTKEEINKQIDDGRIANLMIEDDSITSEKYQDNSIGYDKIMKTQLGCISNLNTDNLLDDYIISGRKSGDGTREWRFDDNSEISNDVIMDYCPTLKVGVDGVNPSIVFQINYNISDNSNYVLKFKAKSETLAQIQIGILGYKNSTFVGHLINHKYVVNGEREISIDFTANNSKYDEYRFAFEILTNNCECPSRTCYFGSLLVVKKGKSENFLRMLDFMDEIPDILGIETMIKNRLYGKIASFNGDSVCYGDGYLGGYGKIIAERNNMIYENVAVNGSSITKGLTDGGGNPRNVLCESVSKMRADADYVILEGGINDAFDWKNGKLSNIGCITQDYSTPLDTTTFCGALETYLKSAKERFNGKKIGYIIVHRMPGQSYPWGTKSQNSFTQIRELIIQACNKYSIPYCDMFNQGLNTNLDYMRTAYTKNGDGVHPNKEGYERFYCDVIEAFMMSL